MPRKYIRVKPEDKDLEEKIEKALKAIKEEGVSVRTAAKLHGVGRMTLQRRLATGEKPKKSVGGQLSLPKEAEMELAEYLKIKANGGFGNILNELKQLVRLYVDANSCEDTPIGTYLRKYCKFKNSMPGEDWCTAFMRRYRLSCKIPSTLEKSRKSADLYRLYKSVHMFTKLVHKPATQKKDNSPCETISPSTSFEQIMADVFKKPNPSTAQAMQK